VQLGVIHLEGAGAHIVRRLLAGGHKCVVFDPSCRLVAELGAECAYGAASVADLANELDAPRAIVLAGPPASIDSTLAELLPHLEAEDIIVVWGNGSYSDDIRRAGTLATRRIHHVDVGVSGTFGVSGQACCLTIGGEDGIVRHLDPILAQLAPGDSKPQDAGTAARGFLHCGSAGAGHFVAMIHDGIERCLMAACAEGFGVLHGAGGATATAHYEFQLRKIAELWRHGSRLDSPVLDLVADALAGLGGLEGPSRPRRQACEDWQAIRAAADEAVAIPVLASAMYRTGESPHDPDFSTRLLHAVQQASSAEAGREVSRLGGRRRPGPSVTT
jgi:6-phosphogluconate dehydrogenase